MSRVLIYTDGGCNPNPGPGGWGVVVSLNGKRRIFCGGELVTTNNRMELMAAVRALEMLNRPCPVTIFTDSQYVRGGITNWIHRWKQNRWRTLAGCPVKNRDLWERLDAAQARHSVEWKWIKGHNGDPMNELADMLAGVGRRDILKGVEA